MERIYLPWHSPQIPFDSQYQHQHQHMNYLSNSPQIPFDSQHQHQHLNNLSNPPPPPKYANEPFPIDCCHNFLKRGKCTNYYCLLKHPECDPCYCMQQECRYLGSRHGCKKGILCNYLHPRYKPAAAAQDSHVSPVTYQSSSATITHQEESPVPTIHKTSSSSKQIKIEYIEKKKVSYVDRKKEILAQLENEFPGETFSLTKNKKRRIL